MWMPKVPVKTQKKLVTTLVSSGRETKWLGDKMGNLLFTVFKQVFKLNLVSSHCGSAVMNTASIHEDVGPIPDLAQWVKDPALLSAVGCRRGCYMLAWQLQLQFDPQPGNFHIPRVGP